MTADIKKISAHITSSMYSHLSNKREVTLTDFEKKIHPPCLLISKIFSTLQPLFIAVKILVFPKKSHPPRLLILQLLHPLHVYSNLLGY